jgi:glycosidase
VHRPRADWQRYARRSRPKTVEGRVYAGLQKLISLRKAHLAFGGGELEVIQTDNPHVLGYVRTHAGERAVIFANFSEHEQPLLPRLVEQYNCLAMQQVYGTSRLQGHLLILAPLDLCIFLSHGE